jgi:predicted nucleic acid-binding protein
MNGGRVTIDTNVLFYSVDWDAGDRHARAVSIIDSAIRWECILLLQALGEFFAAATRKGKMSVTEAAGQVDDWMRLFPVHAAGPATLKRAMWAVQAHGLSFWDAMLWAAAREAGCTLMLSENFQHGRELGGVRFHNPFVEDVPSPPI